MKKLIAVCLAVAALAVRADVGSADDYIERTLFWQITAEQTSLYSASYGMMYAVLSDGSTIEWGDAKGGYELTSQGVKTSTKYADDVLLNGATFYAELLNDQGINLATSDAVKIGDLLEQYFNANPRGETMVDPLNNKGYFAFTFAVPEPTSGLLTLIGIAWLALRRRKAVA